MTGLDGTTDDLARPGARGRTVTGPGGRPARVVVEDLLPLGELVDGRYRVEAPLGQGGMGAVYRARDVAAGRDVALKVLLAGEGSRLLRFEREAELLARLDRVPGVVHVHARGEHRGLPWLAMDLVEGHDLERPLSRGPLPVADALALVEAVARTVHACHALGLVHRDLKPSNILLGREGPRVVDFGLARGGAEARFTATGEIVGTPSFMAPEQTDGSFDARTDVWALGAILHTATTGALVVEATNLLELIHTLRHVDPTPPTALDPRLPPGLDVVVRGALRRDPAARYPTAEALADDCARLRRGEPPLGPGVRPARARRRVAGGLLLLGAALLVGGGAAAWRVTRLAALRAAAEERAVAERAWLAAGQDGWDLGLGSGPAPAAAALGERLAALGAATSPAAAAARAELEELRRRLEGRPGGDGSPLALAVDASIAALRSDLPAAVRLADRSLGHPAGLRLRARLWRPLLAGERDAAGWEELRAWLAARPAGDPAAALASESALAGLVEAVEAVVRGAPSDPDAAGVLARVTRAAGAVGVAPVESLVAAAKARALEDSAADWVTAGAATTDAGVRAFGQRLVELFRTPPLVPCPERLRAAQERLLGGWLQAWAAAPATRRDRLGPLLAEVDLTLLDGVEPLRGFAPELLLRVHKELVASGREGLPVVRLLGLRADAQYPDAVADLLGDAGVLELQRRWPRLRAPRLLALVLDVGRRPPRRGDPRLDAWELLLREKQHDLSPGSWARAVAECARAIEVATREGRTAAERAKVLDLTPGTRHRYTTDPAAALDGWRLEAELQPDVAAFREVVTRGLADLRQRGSPGDPVRAISAVQRLLVEPLARLPAWDDPRPPPARADLEWAQACGREAIDLVLPARADGPSAVQAWVLALRAARLLATPDALDEAEARWARRPARADRVAPSVEWVLLARARGDLAEARRRLASERERLAKAPDVASLERLEAALAD